MLYIGKEKKTIQQIRKYAKEPRYTERHARSLAEALRRRWPDKPVAARYTELFDSCPALSRVGDQVSVDSGWWGRAWRATPLDTSVDVESLHSYGESPYPYQQEDWRTVGVTAELVCKVGEITKRSMMVLSLTFDHRVIDGAMAARYLGTLKGMIEEPMRLLA